MNTSVQTSLPTDIQAALDTNETARSCFAQLPPISPSVCLLPSAMEKAPSEEGATYIS